MRRRDNLLMVDQATSAKASDVYMNSDCDACSVQLSGTFTSATVYVQGKLDPNGTTWVNLAVINLNAFLIDDDGISNSQIYEVGIEGVPCVRLNVTAVSGGNLSAYVSFFNTGAE